MKLAEVFSSAALDADLTVWDNAQAPGVAACELAGLAYQAHGEWREDVRLEGFDDGVMLSAGAAQVGVAWRYDAPANRLLVIIAARGTSEGWDIISDLRSIIRWPWPGVLPSSVWAGKGILRQVQAIGPKLRDHMRSLRTYPDGHPWAELDIVVMGHSLGGVMCYLLLPLLSYWGYRVRVCYTFESPRVFGKKGARWFDSNTRGHKVRPRVTVLPGRWGPVYRVVNFHVAADGRTYRDPVVGAPPSCPPISAKHAGIPVLLKTAGDPAIVGQGPWGNYKDATPLSVLRTLRLAKSARAHGWMEGLRKMKALPGHRAGMDAEEHADGWHTPERDAENDVLPRVILPRKEDTARRRDPDVPA